MSDPVRFHAIVPAAGAGARMGADLPKQYLVLAGRTVLEHSLDVLPWNKTGYRFVNLQRAGGVIETVHALPTGTAPIEKNDQIIYRSAFHKKRTLATDPGPVHKPQAENRKRRRRALPFRTERSGSAGGYGQR